MDKVSMPKVNLKYAPRGTRSHKYRVSLGMVSMPDVDDDGSWKTIVERGIPYFDEWRVQGGQVHTEMSYYALSYKHTEHDFGKLSLEQANELRRVLMKLVGPGPDKVMLWVDSMYMMREGMGLSAYSTDWARYGLEPYIQLPVIRLESEWHNKHPESGKKSGWLWLEKTLGECNMGICTIDGCEKRSVTGLSVQDAVKKWLQEGEGYGFRRDDEKAIQDQIACRAGPASTEFRCPGKSSCVAYMLGQRSRPCEGNSRECAHFAASTNGSRWKDKLILSRVGRIADSILTIIKDEQSGKQYLRREDFKDEELRQYTRVLISRTVAFKNIRLLGLELFD